MDLSIEVTPVSPAELSRAPVGEASGVVAARVRAARARQQARYGAAGARCNATAEEAPLRQGLAAAPAALTLAETAAERLRLSNRGFMRTLRVARTIADLAACATVERAHVAEALAFRLRGKVSG
jgi:magnesium chelatase family protein